MTDHKPLSDENQTPEDVASLYSWANLHGAKYRDFSASRAQTREQARLRVQQAIDEQQARTVQNTDAERDAEDRRLAETTRAEVQAREADLVAQRAAQYAARLAAEQTAYKAAQLAAQQAAELAAKQAAELAAQQAEEQAAAERAAAEWAAAEQAEAKREAAEREAADQAAALRAAAERAAAEREAADQAAAERAAIQAAAEHAAQQAQMAQRAAEQLQAFHDAAERTVRETPPQPERLVAPQFSNPVTPVTANYPPQFGYPVYAPPQADRPAADQPHYEDMRKSNYPTPPWPQPAQRENGSPAWLMPDRTEAPAQAPVTQAPEDTLQGSRERMASRWFALRGVFDPAGAPLDAVPVAPPSRAPVVATFSLAGGVGKTTMVATLGRALSARGERVLLVDTAVFGLLPFFFGAHDQRPGVLRTFSPPGTSGDAPVQMIAIDPEGLGPEPTSQEALSNEIAQYSRGVSRVIVDLATASGATTRRLLGMEPLVVVPMVPDMNSVVSVTSIDSFFQHNGNAAAKQSLPHYVLNQFDPSLPLHLDIREMLREQLGERLLPFVLRRAPAVSEALAEGMTVMDYAPNSTVAEDYGVLAGWVKSQSAPASTSYRGVRWSER
jgi:cellulose synthase operon protein YhjQ